MTDTAFDADAEGQYVGDHIDDSYPSPSVYTNAAVEAAQTAPEIQDPVADGSAAAPAAITGGESPTEAEHNAVIAALADAIADTDDIRTALNVVIAALTTAGFVTGS